MAKRGANQSVSTKYATTLLCDALRLLDIGKVGNAHELIKEAVSMLPDVNDSAQCEACSESKKKNRGIAA